MLWKYPVLPVNPSGLLGNDFGEVIRGLKKWISVTQEKRNGERNCSKKWKMYFETIVAVLVSGRTANQRVTKGTCIILSRTIGNHLQGILRGAWSLSALRTLPLLSTV